MRVILDTSLFLSALLKRQAPPRQLYDYWRQGRFALVSADQQLAELRAVLQRPFFLERVKRSEAGAMINGIRRLAIMYDPEPQLRASIDPSDDYLLALAEVSRADILATGDKGHLLQLGHHGPTRIVTARELLSLLRG